MILGAELYQDPDTLPTLIRHQGGMFIRISEGLPQVYFGFPPKVEDSDRYQKAVIFPPHDCMYSMIRNISVSYAQTLCVLRCQLSEIVCYPQLGHLREKNSLGIVF